MGESSNRPIRLALVGLGNQGQEHLAAARLSNQVIFTAGVDPAPTSREAAARNWPGESMVLGRELGALADLDLDGLVLALPHHCYEPIWDQLLSFGLPLLKEKPLGRNYDEAFSLLTRAQSAGCPLQTAIQRRHHPSYKSLKALLDAGEARIEELHAHLHLGFAETTGGDDSWRGDRRTAGGGALLDAGYHLVDLIHYLAGPFELVSASLWCDGLPAEQDDIDDRAWVTGRSEHCWVMLDSWRSGDADPFTATPRKSEGVLLKTSKGIWRANREGVWHDGERLTTSARDWQNAMADQLDQFAFNIRAGSWHQTAIWDQLPAMQVIDEAYRLASR